MVSPNFSFAQETEKLTSTIQKEIISELSKLIKKEYILEDIGLKMISKLDSLSNENLLIEDTDSEEFIITLNKTLQSVYVDKHLAVVNRQKFEELKQMFGIEDDDHKKTESHNQQPEKHGKKEAVSEHKTPESHGKQPEKHGKKAAVAEHKIPESHGKQPEKHDKKEAVGHHKSPESHNSTSNKSINELAGSRVINRDGRTDIGLLKINKFDGTQRGLNNMERLLTSFIGVDAIIIDLRACRGGDADMVKALSGYFFNTSTYLVSTIGRKDEKGKRETIERWSEATELSSNFYNTPIYIMTSSKTFSAAESFAFGLQLNKRATIVGENTGGGGHMNTFFALPGGYGVAVSVGRTFDGKTGKGFQTKGVLPEIQVEANHAFVKTLELIKNKRTKKLAYETSKEEVHKTLQRFSEAWYSGNFTDAKPIIHDLCKSYLSTNNKIEEVNILKLIKNGEGSKTPREVKNRVISVYEVRNNETAIARLMFRDQIHYLHLVNNNGSWKIVSDLITRKQMHG